MKTVRYLAGAAATGLLLGAGAAHAGKLYKWVDDKGITHYSETIPADQKDRSSTEIDKKGRVLKQNEAALTKDQVQAIQEERIRRKSEEKQVEEQRRRDNALLNTYTTESEIDDARVRAIAGATQAKQAIEARYKTALSRSTGLRKQVDGLVKTGKPVPEAVREELTTSEQDTAKIAGELKLKEAEIANLQQKYDYDKTRFKELMAGTRR